jgi:hypothetical protein
MAVEVRVLRALDKLGIRTIDALLELDASRLLAIRGCGKGVYQHVVSVQSWLRSEEADATLGKQIRSFLFGFLTVFLPWRTRRILSRLRIRDLQGLTAVRLIDVENLGEAYFSSGAWDQIVLLRRQAIQVLGRIALRREEGAAIRDPRTILLEPPAEDSVLALPLFSDLEAELFAGARFHPGWHAGWKLSDLTLPHRVRTLCRDAGAESFGQLLLLPATEFVMKRGSGSTSLEDVRDVARFLLLGGLAKKLREVDYGSFKAMVESWIAATLPDKRARETYLRVACKRFEVRDGKLPPWSAIAQECGVSPSRGAQVRKQARENLGRRQSLAILEPFWREVMRELEGGPAKVDRLAESVARAFRWPLPAPAAALWALLSLHPEIRAVKPGYLGLERQVAGGEEQADLTTVAM